LNTINQQILSRTRLERIINEFNLYENERRNGIMEDVVQRMRTQDIGVETLKGDAFRVSYVGSNPQVVMRVTDRLASMFIDENLRDRENLAQGTSSFLTAQLEEARRRLIEQEKKLEAYRSAHAGELPSQADTNLQMVQNTQMQLQQLVESINRDRDQRHLVERALADLNAMASSGVIAPENIDASQQPVAWQLAAAQRALQEMSLRLKPEHPDIHRMKRVIEGLQKRAEEEALTAPLSPEAGVGATPAQVLQNNRLKELQQQLDNIDRQMAAKRAEETRLRSVAAVYQARLEAVPTRETELSELTRDYSTLQSMYSSLLAKNEESKIAASLERRQIGEQFKILDPAKTAERPFSPNRPRINLVGSVAGLCLGLCLAGLLEYKDTSFRSHDDVISVLGLPVLAQIPLMLTSAERRGLRQRRVLAGAGAAVVVLATGAALWKIGALSTLLR
jgi:polysaccharide chain length determinant protein (PEP-CTERM system associated)